jgi:hypothetical protein
MPNIARENQTPKAGCQTTSEQTREGHGTCDEQGKQRQNYQK